MNRRSLHMIGLVAMAAGLLAVAPAQAQYYGAGYGRQPPPLYPYEVQPNQPYAVQVAPNTYVIRRPSPDGGCGDDCGRRRSRIRHAERSERPHKRNDPALIEELRRRHAAKPDVVNTTQIVRDPPVVVETKRIVDDPPRIVERRHYVDDAAQASARRKQAVTIDTRDLRARSGDDNKKRVIQAEAEITILGPDRMSIRLFRKRSHGGRASARAE